MTYGVVCRSVATWEASCRSGRKLCERVGVVNRRLAVCRWCVGGFGLSTETKSVGNRRRVTREVVSSSRYLARWGRPIVPRGAAQSCKLQDLGRVGDDGDDDDDEG